MPARVRHPWQGRLEKPLYYRLLTPGIIGSLTGAAFGAVPSSSLRSLFPPISLPAQVEGVVFRIPSRIYMVLLGFLLGFSVSKSVGWLRLRAIKALLAYQGWVHGGKSSKTKLWAMLLKILKGPRPFHTYEFQRLLPKQPLPTLEATLDKWLRVCSQLESHDDFILTQQAIEAFRQNEGPKLQEHLIKRARDEVNWQYEYWMNAAYLLNREPLAIKSNYYESLLLKESTTTNQIARTATVIYHLGRYAELLDNETLPPVELMNLVPLCMNGYRFIFNCSRIPGEHIDTLARFSGKKHIIVIKNGRYFVMDMYAQSKSKKKTLLNIKEIKQQLMSVSEMAEKMGERCDVAVLTTQNRPLWAKHREILSKKNQAALHLVESAMFHVNLDDAEFDDVNLAYKRLLTGDGTDRWFDKCFTASIQRNAWGGHCVEHSAIDAMVFVTMSEFQVVFEKYDVDGDILCSPNTKVRDLPKPQLLQWNLDGLHEAVTAALNDYQLKIDNIDLFVLTCPYSKGFIKKQRLSPDAYVQMAFQLAYYNQYGEIVKTYEPSTGRLYALGRTETVHPASPFCSAWVKSMRDPTTTTHTRRTLLRKAVEHQTNFRLEATIGQGCDRHLLGLYLASRELGMDTPAIFADKPWRMPFTLSTSQTPTSISNYESVVDIAGVTGGFAPSCPGGYGLSYVTHTDDLLMAVITSWKEDKGTSSEGFGHAINAALDEMKQIFIS